MVGFAAPRKVGANEMPRAKQPGTVEAHQDDVTAQVQVNGTKPGGVPESAEGKAGAAKRVAVKGTKGTGETSKEDVTTKAQHPKPHAKPEPAPKAPEASDGLSKAGAPGDEPRDLFLEHQRTLLAAERNNYTRQAEELKAQADALALEHEPGDVQFDEEGGEGGTANVDRELDLHLSAQAQAAIEEIDAALVKIGKGTYGFCESCGNPVPAARLEALPHARLCVSCKSGGLSTRRQ
jgi:DnaK suppressor protein